MSGGCASTVRCVCGNSRVTDGGVVRHAPVLFIGRRRTAIAYQTQVFGAETAASPAGRDGDHGSQSRSLLALPASHSSLLVLPGLNFSEPKKYQHAPVRSVISLACQERTAGRGGPRRNLASCASTVPCEFYSAPVSGPRSEWFGLTRRKSRQAPKLSAASCGAQTLELWFYDVPKRPPG